MTTTVEFPCRTCAQLGARFAGGLCAPCEQSAAAAHVATAAIPTQPAAPPAPPAVPPPAVPSQLVAPATTAPLVPSRPWLRPPADDVSSPLPGQPAACAQEMSGPAELYWDLAAQGYVRRRSVSGWVRGCSTVWS